MPDLLEIARAKVAEALQRVEYYQGILRNLESAALALGQEVNENLTAVAGDTPVDKQRMDRPPEPERESATESVPKRQRVTDNPKPAIVVDYVMMILREHGRPMSRGQLHRKLLELGVNIRGADPVKTLGTMLWRAKDDLISLGDGYWPKADPFDAAGYNPQRGLNEAPKTSTPTLGAKLQDLL